MGKHNPKHPHYSFAAIKEAAAAVLYSREEPMPYRDLFKEIERRLPGASYSSVGTCLHLSGAFRSLGNKVGWVMRFGPIQLPNLATPEPSILEPAEEELSKPVKIPLPKVGVDPFGLHHLPENPFAALGTPLPDYIGTPQIEPASQMVPRRWCAAELADHPLRPRRCKISAWYLREWDPRSRFKGLIGIYLGTAQNYYGLSDEETTRQSMNDAHIVRWPGGRIEIHDRDFIEITG